MGGAKPAECSAPVWDSIPSDLRSRRQWLLWFWESRGGRWTKPPRQPNGSPAKTDDEATWVTFERAQTAFETSRGHKFDGVGFVLTDNDQFCGFDFDGCLDGQLKITDRTIAEYVERLNSYTEVSPSLTGLRVIVRAQLPPAGRKKGNIECYDRGRYLTITGNVWGGSRPLAARQAEVSAIHAAIFSNNGNRNHQQHNNQKDAGGANLGDIELLNHARRAGNRHKFTALYDRGDWQGQGYPSRSEAHLALCSLLAFWTSRDAARIDSLFHRSALCDARWDRDDYREMTIAKAIATCAEVYSENGTSSKKHRNDEPGTIQHAENAQSNDETAEPESSLEKARAYLSEHDSEANTNHDNAAIIYSPEYSAAATTLYEEVPLEYRSLESKLKGRGYHISDFQRKRRELEAEQKELLKQQQQTISRANRRTAASSPQQHPGNNGAQNGAAPQQSAIDRWKATLLVDSCPFVPKGYSAGDRTRSYYYLKRATNALISLALSHHRPPSLFDLASNEWWMNNYHCSKGEHVSIDWESAQSDLFAAGSAAGVFDPTRAKRGVGVWDDDGRLIFHRGDVIVAEDGTVVPLGKFKTEYIYEPRARVDIDITKRASDEEAERLITVLEGFRWKNPIAPKLLAGWIAAAPLAGALPFRPTAWITAGDESGKSTLLEHVTIPILGGDTGGFVIIPSGSQTTEAFLRQSIGPDSKPVVFDEADAPDTSSNKRRTNMTAILNYIRGSNSAGGVGKGSPDGTPVKFGGKPMFLIASISLPLAQSADLGRTLVFELWRPEKTGEAASKYAELRETIAGHFTPTHGRRFIARCIHFAPVTLQNISVYRTALINCGHDARTADRLAVVLAGGRSLTDKAGVVIAQDEATTEKMSKAKFGDFANKEGHAENRDERHFWDHVISFRLRIDNALRIDNTNYRIGELIDNLRGKSAGTVDQDHSLSGQRAALSRVGIKFDPTGAELHFARGKKVFAEILQDTPWHDNYYLHLNRLLEASGRNPQDYAGQLRFPGIGRPHTVIFPAELLNELFDDRDESE